MQAELFLVLADREAREGALNDERRDAAGALGLIGHGEYDENVRHITVGDEDLGAVEDIVVAVEHCGAGALGSIRTGVRLGQRERAYLVTLGQHAEVLLLLRLGAVLDDWAAAQTVMLSLIHI